VAKAESRRCRRAGRVLVSDLFGLATIAGFLIAGVWGAGSSIIPLAARGARGSDFQETVIQIVMYPAAPTGIISFALILWDLRKASRRKESTT
jgi:hypothetical protein